MVVRSKRKAKPKRNIKVTLHYYTKEEREARAKQLETAQKPTGNKCPKCGKTYKYVKCLNKHMKEHDNEQPEEQKILKCPTCGATFKTQGWLKRHMKEKHNIEPEQEPVENKPKQEPSGNKCPKCGKTYKYIKCLNKHMKEHDNEQPKEPKIFKCPKCGATFKTQGWFKRHMKDKHSIEIEHEPVKNKPKQKPPKYDCPKCGAKYTSEKWFNRHTQDCKAFRCPNCNKIYHNKQQYMKHILQCDNQRYRCEICNQTFRSKYHLTKHKQSRKHIIKEYNIKSSPNENANTFVERLFSRNNRGTQHISLHFQVWLWDESFSYKIYKEEGSPPLGPNKVIIDESLFVNNKDIHVTLRNEGAIYQWLYERIDIRLWFGGCPSDENTEDADVFYNITENTIDK